MWESSVLRRAFERLELHEGKLSRAVLSSTSALFVAPRTPIFPGFSRMVARLFANPRGPVGFQELKNTSFFQAFLVTRDYKMGRSRAERVTLDVHLAGMMGMMSGLYHSAAALFQAMPAWLRFLESRRLIDADTSRKVAAELLPLHATLLRIWEQYTDDPLLYRQGQAWLTLP